MTANDALHEFEEFVDKVFTPGKGESADKRSKTLQDAIKGILKKHEKNGDALLTEDKERAKRCKL
jgi:hypothetical protein